MKRRLQSRSFDEIFVDSLNLSEKKKSHFNSEKKKSCHTLTLDLQFLHDDEIHDEYFNISSEGEEMEQLIIPSPKKIFENSFHINNDKKIVIKNYHKLTENVKFIKYERTKEMEEILMNCLKEHFYFRTLTALQRQIPKFLNIFNKHYLILYYFCIYLLYFI
jgi:hypothetical protein